MTPLARYFPAREKGHVKHFWCYKCQKEQAHIEEQQFAHKHEGEIY